MTKNPLNTDKKMKLHGGKRPNAGRKHINEGNPEKPNGININLTLDDVSMVHLKLRGNGNMSLGVRILCKEDIARSNVESKSGK